MRIRRVQTVTIRQFGRFFKNRKIMELIGKKGIPTDVFEGNSAISNDKLILVDGTFKRGFYSYATKKWSWIEEFETVIKGLEGGSKLIWFDLK